MGTRRLTTLFATAAIATATLATGLSVTAASAAVAPHTGSHALRPANWACYGYGTGATLKAAQIAARQDFVGNKTVGALVYTNGQFADGSWWAEIAGDCYFVE
jgi:hypothetical protein